MTPERPSLPLTAYRNGDFVPHEAVTISPVDAGFVWGATVVDRLRTYGLVPFRLDDHITRFFQSARLCHIPIRQSPDEIRQICRELIQRNSSAVGSDGELALLLLATPGVVNLPTLIVTAAPFDPAPYRDLVRRGAVLVSPETRHVPESLIPRQAKMRSRMFWWIAEQQAKAVDPAAQALLLDDQGFVTETAMGNVAAIVGQSLLSPRFANILQGVSLQTIWNLGSELGLECVEQDVTPESLAQADEVLLTCSSFAFAPVRQYLGRTWPAPGPWASRIRQRWSDLVGRDVWREFAVGR